MCMYLFVQLINVVFLLQYRHIFDIVISCSIILQFLYVFGANLCFQHVPYYYL